MSVVLKLKKSISPKLSSIILLPLFALLFSGISFGSTFVSLHGDMGNQDYGFGLKFTREIPSFKVFVPPGTTMINLRVYCVNDARNMHAVSRFKVAPRDYGTPPSYEEGRGYTLSQLKNDNRFSLNHDGLVLISRNFFSEPLSIDESGWLFVRILGGWDVKWINYNINVNGEIYNNWYETVDWFTDVDLGGVYVPPGNTTPPPNNDPPSSDDDDENDDGTDDDPFGRPDRDYKQPSKRRDIPEDCNNPFLCGFDGYTPPGDDDGDGGSPGDGSGISNPVFSINCGKNSKKEITGNHLEGRTIAIPQPVMSTVGTSESLNYYAMIMIGAKTFMAVKDEMHPTIVSFIEYKEGDRIRSYKRGPLETNGYWVCDVFGETLHDLDVPVQVMAQYEVHFLCGYAPEGEVENGNFENLEYVDLWFSPSLK